ncbi:hypothetical protein ABZ636_36610 [Streptomyces sp. NPDC007251]|uniref:hypothetical protein n=1 Tax=Streptomyces sp. NPDC007251 TaxID=3154483 RepID=UPI0033D8AC37
MEQQLHEPGYVQSQLTGVFRHGPVAHEPADWLAWQKWTATEVTTVTEEGRKEARTIPDNFARPGAKDVSRFAGARQGD